MTAQAMHSSVCATATAAFLMFSRPNRRASRRNRAPGRLAVRETAHAPSTIADFRCGLPLRAAAFLRLPADSLSPGASPAQAASRELLANRAMSPPVSATITCAMRGPIPGMVTRRARQPPRIAFPGDQRLDHLPPRDARQLRGHRVDLDAVLEHLRQPLPLRRAVLDQLL